MQEAHLQRLQKPVLKMPLGMPWQDAGILQGIPAAFAGSDNQTFSLREECKCTPFGSEMNCSETLRLNENENQLL